MRNQQRPKWVYLGEMAAAQLADTEHLVLVGAAGFSYEEAAEISGCAVGTIKSRVNRARGRLAESLDLSEDDLKEPDAAVPARTKFA